MTKLTYNAPVIVAIRLDNEISLQLSSADDENYPTPGPELSHRGSNMPSFTDVTVINPFHDI